MSVSPLLVCLHRRPDLLTRKTLRRMFVTFSCFPVSVSVSFCLSLCLFVSHSLSLSVCVSTYMFIHTYASTHIFIYTNIYNVFGTSLSVCSAGTNWLELRQVSDRHLWRSLWLLRPRCAAFISRGRYSSDYKETKERLQTHSRGQHHPTSTSPSCCSCY